MAWFSKSFGDFGRYIASVRGFFFYNDIYNYLKQEFKLRIICIE